MPAGIQVFNDDGYTQITDSAYNYALIGKASGSFPASSNAYSSVSTTISVTSAKCPFIAFANTGSRYIAVASVVRSGSTWTFTLGSGPGPAFTFTVYFFTVASDLSVGTYGLQVINSAGVVMFDSSRPIMRIASVIQLPDRSDYQPPVVHATMPSGKSYAVGMSYNKKTFMETFVVEEPWTGVYVAAVRSSGTGVSGGFEVVGIIPDDPGRYPNTDFRSCPQVLVFNVTNY